MFKTVPYLDWKVTYIACLIFCKIDTLNLRLDAAHFVQGRFINE
jgi:hypothetical protein